MFVAVSLALECREKEHTKQTYKTLNEGRKATEGEGKPIEKGATE